MLGMVVLSVIDGKAMVVEAALVIEELIQLAKKFHEAAKRVRRLGHQ